MKILFMTETEPFPPNTGERLRSYNMINSILEFADKLYLICGSRPPDEEKYLKVEYYPFPDIYPKNRRWENLTMLFRTHPGIVQTIEKIIERDKIDIAILDYNFIGNYISIFKRRNIRVIYGTHNIQSELNYQTPARAFKDYFYKQLRYLLEKYHEFRFFRKADAILTVSDEDLKYYQKHFNRTDLFMVPNYIDEKAYENEHLKEKKQQIIMSGNYFAFQNKFGMRWFIENVWDSELAGMAEFIIVGHGSVEEFKKIRESGIYIENIKALGTVDNMKKYIAASKVAIIPLLHGSGTRLKCVEAMALKTNIVSTSIGVEGIKHNGAILTADDKPGFKKQLIQVLKGDVNNEEKAWTIFLESYSAQAITPKLKAILENYL